MNTTIKRYALIALLSIYSLVHTAANTESTSESSGSGQLFRTKNLSPDDFQLFFSAFAALQEKANDENVTDRTVRLKETSANIENTDNALPVDKEKQDNLDDQTNRIYPKRATSNANDSFDDEESLSALDAERLFNAVTALRKIGIENVTVPVIIGFLTDEIMNDEIAPIILANIVDKLLKNDDGQPVPSSLPSEDKLNPLVEAAVNGWLSQMITPAQLAEIIDATNSGKLLSGRPLSESEEILFDAILDGAIRHKLLTDPTYTMFQHEAKYQKALKITQASIERYTGKPLLSATLPTATTTKRSLWRRILRRK